MPRASWSRGCGQRRLTVPSLHARVRSAGLAGLLWLASFGVVGPASADCVGAEPDEGDGADRPARIAILEQATIEGRFEAADAASRALLESFGCGPLAEPPVLARMWLSQAVLYAARGSDDAADDALAAAARVSPTTWNDMYGPTLQERWASTAERLDPSPATLRVEPLPAGWVAAVDGERMTVPAELPSGPHLLQLGPKPFGSGPARFEVARMFYLAPAGELSIDPELPARPVAHRPMTQRSRRLVHGLIVGGAAVALYGTTFATHAAYNGQPVDAKSGGLRFANNAMIIGSVGLGVTSGAMVARALTTPVPD